MIPEPPEQPQSINDPPPYFTAGYHMLLPVHMQSTCFCQHADGLICKHSSYYSSKDFCCIFRAFQSIFEVASYESSLNFRQQQESVLKLYSSKTVFFGLFLPLPNHPFYCVWQGAHESKSCQISCSV